MMKTTVDKQAKTDVRTKSEYISFRLTEREKHKLKFMMEAAGFDNKADFIRFCIFDKEHYDEAVTNLKKYWEKVNCYMNKIKRETLAYEQEALKQRPTNANKNVSPTKK